MTTRTGGHSHGPFASLNLGARVGDDPNAVERNREVLRSAVPADPVWLHQVHGIDVVDAASAPPLPRADGAVCRTRNTICAVLSADCLPVLLADAGATTVGIAHAGWRGLAAGVVEATLAAMRVPPQQIVAWLGPAIGPAAFEVGEDVFAAFTRADPGAADDFRAGAQGKFHADLYALARRRLAAAGVVSVHGGGYCTYTEGERFFSYRRDGVTGRMASAIWLA